MTYSDLGRNDDFPIIVIANKCDVPEHARAVSDINAHAWCAANGDAPYIEASAKEGINVEEIFQAGIKKFLEIEKAKRGDNGKSRHLRDTVILTKEDILDEAGEDIEVKRKKCCS